MVCYRTMLNACRLLWGEEVWINIGYSKLYHRFDIVVVIVIKTLLCCHNIAWKWTDLSLKLNYMTVWYKKKAGTDNIVMILVLYI